MRARTRRKLEMGVRVLEFSRQHPDPSPGYVAAATRLEERLARAGELARQQLDGVSEVHASTARKRDLRRMMKLGHLNHLISVAQVASVEDSELLQKFDFPNGANSYLSFQTAAAGIAAEAESRKELLVKHGLSEDVLSGLKVAIDQFESAVEQGAAGRLAHVGASAQLVTIADEVVQVVKVMNGLNRVRFAGDSELLAAWESATNVVATARPEPKVPPSPGPSGPGEIRPAA
jgi:hypothetical protein